MKHLPFAAGGSFARLVPSSRGFWSRRATVVSTIAGAASLMLRPAGLLAASATITSLTVLAILVWPVSAGDQPGLSVPANLSVGATDGGATLTWDLPAHDAGSATGYEILRHRPAGAAAVGGEGVGDDPPLAVMPSHGGNVVEKISVDSITRTLANVSVRADNGDSSTNQTFYLRYRPLGATSWTQPLNKISTGTSLSFGLMGLKDRTQYEVEASMESNFPTEHEQKTTFRTRPSDLDIDVSANTSDPAGIWSNGTTLWVVDSPHSGVNDDAIDAYNLSDGTYDSSKQVPNSVVDDFGSGSTTPSGLWGSGDTLWMVVGDPPNNLLGAIDVSVSPPAKTAAVNDDFTLSTSHWGVWGNDDYVWVSYTSPVQILAYDRSTMARVSGQDFTRSTLSGAGNDHPRGIWSDGATMWVADQSDVKVYAYNLSDKTRNAAQDWNLDGVNRNARGLWSDGQTIYVSDTGRDKLYAYHLPGSLPPRVRVAGFATHSDNAHPTDIWGNQETIWISDDTDDKIYAYRRSDASRDSSKDFTLDSNNTAPTGICSDGTTMFVSEWNEAKVFAYKMADRTYDSTSDITTNSNNLRAEAVWCDADTLWVAEDDSGADNRIYAYNLSDGTEDTSKDFDTLVVGADATEQNHDPRGLWSNGQTMFVVDRADDKVYAYRMSDQAEDSAKNITLDPANDRPEGIWFDGRVLLVVDKDDKYVYAYDLPGAQEGNTPAAGAPSITGVAVQNATLTGDVSGISDGDGIDPDGFLYQWIRVDGTTETDIADAIESTYTLTAQDVGKALRVRVVFNDLAGNAEFPRTSPQSDMVAGPITLVSNLGQTTTTSPLHLNATTTKRGQAFTVGSGSYALSSVAVDFVEINDTAKAGDALEVSLYDESGGSPGSALCTLNDPAAFADDDKNIFTASTTGQRCPELTGGTTYFVVIDRVNASSETTAIRLTNLVIGGEDAGGAAGWSIADSRYDFTSGSWSESSGGIRALQMEVKGGGLASIPGVTLSKSALTIAEGGSGSYTVVLDTEPTASVSVGITAGDDVTTNPTSVTFSTTTWDVPQVVTVNAGEDLDSANDTVTITHAATSADSDYNGIDIAGVEVTVTDNEVPGVTVSRTSLDLSEGSGGIYTVTLNTQPTADVTVNITKSGPDSGDVTVSPTSLVFTDTNWNVGRTVTVTALDDGDADKRHRVHRPRHCLGQRGGVRRPHQPAQRVGERG